MNRFAYFVTALAFACSPVKGTPLIDAKVVDVESLTVMPASVSGRVALDPPTQLAVMAALSDGTTRDVTPYVTWSSSDVSVADAPIGLVTAHGSGAATITATLDSAVGSAQVSFRDPILVSANEQNGNTPASLSFYDAFASGNVGPLRSIGGANAPLPIAREMFADIANDELYVITETTGLSVYPLDGSGDIAPKRTLPTGSASGFEDTLGVALYKGELYVAGLNSAGSGIVSVFDTQTLGSAATPTRSLIGADTGLATPLYLFAQNDELYVVDLGSHSVLVFPTQSSGDAAPTRKIAGSATDMVNPFSVAIADSEMYVADISANAIFVFPESGSGNIAPLRQIRGLDSGMAGPASVQLVGSDLVCDQTSGSAAIATYAREAVEDAPPTRVLAGSNTGLVVPFGILVY